MKAANQRIVYNASRETKAKAFAKREARLHIGTMTRYIKAGIVRKHYMTQNNQYQVLSKGDDGLTRAKKNLVELPVGPSFVRTAMVMQAAMKISRTWKTCATTLHF
jgi:hypothetical protein